MWTCRRNIENIRVGNFEHLNELELTLLPFLKLTFYHSREEPWDSLVAKESQFLTKSAVSTLSWPRLHLCLNFLMKFSWRLGSVILSFQPKLMPGFWVNVSSAIVGGGGIWTLDVSVGDTRRCQPIELQGSWRPVWVFYSSSSYCYYFLILWGLYFSDRNYSVRDEKIQFKCFFFFVHECFVSASYFFSSFGLFLLQLRSEPFFLVEICLDGEEWNDGLLATIRERVWLC